MRQISPSGQQALGEIAVRHGFGADATATMLDAIANGHGGMAQFSHPEFGGSGQWMRGGMTMIGDMFNTGLKARVVALADDLASLWASEPAPAEADARGGHWWPAHLGQADSTGSQNATRYAYFADAHRLAIERDGRLTIQDTLDHRIAGFSQQQSHAGSMRFTSQHGVVDVAGLPVVSGGAAADAEGQVAPAADRGVSADAGSPDALATIERLAALRAKGILSEAEFGAKKTELLARL